MDPFSWCSCVLWIIEASQLCWLAHPHASPKCSLTNAITPPETYVRSTGMCRLMTSSEIGELALTSNSWILYHCFSEWLARKYESWFIILLRDLCEFRMENGSHIFTIMLLPICSFIIPLVVRRGYPLGNTGVAHLPGGRHIITCLADGSLKQWDLNINAWIGKVRRDTREKATVIAYEGSSCRPCLEVIFKNDLPLSSAQVIMPSYFRWWSIGKYIQLEMLCGEQKTSDLCLARGLLSKRKGRMRRVVIPTWDSEWRFDEGRTAWFGAVQAVDIARMEIGHQWFTWQEGLFFTSVWGGMDVQVSNDYRPATRREPGEVEIMCSILKVCQDCPR